MTAPASSRAFRPEMALSLARPRKSTPTAIDPRPRVWLIRPSETKAPYSMASIESAAARTSSAMPTPPHRAANRTMAGPPYRSLAAPRTGLATMVSCATSWTLRRAAVWAGQEEEEEAPSPSPPPSPHLPENAPPASSMSCIGPQPKNAPAYRKTHRPVTERRASLVLRAPPSASVSALSSSSSAPGPGPGPGPGAGSGGGVSVIPNSPPPLSRGDEKGLRDRGD